MGGDRLGDRVFGLGLECCRVLEGLGGAEDAFHGHAALGDGAGLVQHDRVNAAGGLKDFWALDEHAELCATARTDQQGGWRGQAQSARASDDEDRHGGREGGLSGVAPDHPRGEREDRDDDDHGYEYRGDAVGEALNGCLAGLCGGDEPANRGQRGVLAHAGRTDQEVSGGVDRGTGDVVSGADLDGDGLAGQERGVDCGGALGDHAVRGDLLAGTHGEHVADHERLDGNKLLAGLAVGTGDDAVRVFSAHFQQGPQGVSGAAARVVLGVPAGQQERGHHCGGFKVELGHHSMPARTRQERHVHGHADLPGATKEERPQRPQGRGDHAKRDQRVHGGRTVARGLEGSLVEGPRPPRHHGKGECGNEPLPAGELQRRDHGQQEHGQREDRGANESRLQDCTAVLGGCGRVQLDGLWGLGLLGGLVVTSGDASAVSGTLDCGYEVLVRHGLGEHNVCGFKWQVNGGHCPGNLVDALLHACNAGGAGHAGDRKVNFSDDRLGVRLEWLARLRFGGRTHVNQLLGSTVEERRRSACVRVGPSRGSARSDAWGSLRLPQSVPVR